MPKNPPDGYHTITPQSITADPAVTLDFVEKVFSADVKDVYRMDDVIVHAEFVVGDSRMMVGAANEEFPPYPSTVHLYVDDVDATYALALEHGAETIRPPEDQFYGDRTAVVIDPQRNQWSIATNIEDVTPEELHRRMAEMDD